MLDDDQEARFQDYAVSISKSQVPGVAIAGAILYMAYAPWDSVLLGGDGYIPTLLRGVGVASLTGIYWLATRGQLTSASSYWRTLSALAIINQFCIAGIVGAFEGGLTRDAGVSGSGGAYSISLGMLFTAGLFGLPFVRALIVVGVAVPVNLLSFIVSTDQSPLDAVVFFFNTACIAGASAFIARTREQYLRESFRLSKLLEVERLRSERVLHETFPATVVDRLKAGERLIANDHAEVTVLFADLVGFTALGSQLGCRQLVALLDEIFSDFDAVASRFELEKVKTIGDSYMAVCGVSNWSADHAARTVQAGAEMCRVLANRATVRGMDIALRVGINSGPLVSGVIGDRTPAFDCWGDTVNLASRMESTGLPGHIHISEATHWQIRDRFQFADRGEIDVKGKGRIRTFLAAWESLANR